MRNRFSKLALVVSLILTATIVLAQDTRTVNLYERQSQSNRETLVLAIGEHIWIPLTFVTKQWGLQRKDLPNGQLGICRDDVCVPFKTGDGDDALRAVDGEVFVPVRRLVEGLRGSLVWDAEAGTLLIDLSLQPARASALVGKTLELTLPDLGGDAISLSSFRGRKLLLFAWASW